MTTKQYNLTYIETLQKVELGSGEILSLDRHNHRMVSITLGDCDIVHWFTYSQTAIAEGFFELYRYTYHLDNFAEQLRKNESIRFSIKEFGKDNETFFLILRAAHKECVHGTVYFEEKYKNEIKVSKFPLYAHPVSIAQFLQGVNMSNIKEQVWSDIATFCLKHRKEYLEELVKHLIIKK